MQSFPIAAYAVAMNTISRTGGGGSGGGGGDDDEFLNFLKWFNIIMGSLCVIACIFLVRSCHMHEVVQRDSSKIELHVISTQAERTTGKHKKDYWQLHLKDTAGKEYDHTFPRSGTDEVFEIDIKFSTIIVWHTLRNGEKRYYFPDIGKDIPKIKKDEHQN